MKIFGSSENIYKISRGNAARLTDEKLCLVQLGPHLPCYLLVSNDTPLNEKKSMMCLSHNLLKMTDESLNERTMLTPYLFTTHTF